MSSPRATEKRRSTRILQAIPVTVSATDMLGQPFKERTTTVTVNRHGCKYRSKHHVPRNSLITLEIAQPGSASPAKQIQGRVASVQRPHSVRDLFQIGLEFETPANVGDIPFPPEDWFAAPAEKKQVRDPRKALNKALEMVEEVEEIIVEESSNDRVKDYPSASLRRKPRAAAKNPKKKTAWDVFICHASEDKDSFVRPLAEALRAEGLRVWYDEFTLRVGDGLRRSIDKGLASSKFGAVVISPSFFAKEWPQRELDGLVAKEIGERRIILPVWHNVSLEDVREHSITLADRIAANSAEGIRSVVTKLLLAIRGNC
jgi:hypothetical protein